MTTNRNEAELLDMSDERYFALKSVDQSSLKTYLGNPRKWAYERLHADERTTTDAMRLGTAFHAYLMDTGPVESIPAGETFAKKANAQLRDDLSKAGGMAVSARDMALLKRMRGNIESASREDGNPDYMRLLREGRCEQVIEWTDPRTGLRLKAKPDCIPRGVDFLIDLKTAKSADPDEFARHAYDLGYHIQAAFYAWAVAQIDPALLGRTTRRVSGMQFWTFEKDGPCDWRPYSISRGNQMYSNASDAIRAGLNGLKADVERAANMGYGDDLDAAARMLMDHGGYPKAGAEELEFPDWALRDAERVGVVA